MNGVKVLFRHKKVQIQLKRYILKIKSVQFSVYKIVCTNRKGISVDMNTMLIRRYFQNIIYKDQIEMKSKYNPYKNVPHRFTMLSISTS